MTVIIALRESDTSILLAGDGEVSEEGALRLTLQKLRKHHSKPLAWGYIGNNIIDNEGFSQWLQSDKRPNEWIPFVQQAIKEFSELNGRQIQLVKSTGRIPTPKDMIACLLIGWLDKANIVELSESGKATSYIDAGFHAMGAGKVHAYTAQRVLSTIGGYKPLDMLNMIMEITTSLASGCGKPYWIWRITPDGVTELNAEGTTP